MEGWQKGAQAVMKFSSAGKQKYFKQFPEREAWFKQTFPQNFGSSATVATTSLKKVNKAKVQKQRLALIRHQALKRDQLKQLKISSDAVRAMGVRRREGDEGLGGGLETNRDIISHVRGGGTIGSGGLGSLFEAKTGVYSEEGNWYYNGQLFPSEKEARAAEKSDKIDNYQFKIDKFDKDIERLAFDEKPSPTSAPSVTTSTPKIGDRVTIKRLDGTDTERVWTGTGWSSPDSYGKLPSDRATNFKDLERPGRDWPEKDKDPNWGAALGMKNGWMGDKDEQYAIIKTPPAGSEINTRGKRLPFSTIVQGGDVPIDQAKKRGGYYTGRNMEELSRVNEESDNMNNEKNQLSQVAKKLAAKVMEKKRLQEECMPMEMSMESKPHTKEAEDEPGEYDYEGDMAKSQLRSIGYNAKMLHDMLEDNTNLPEWVQSKITLAEDYILTAANYMRSEMNMNEEVKQINESASHLLYSGQVNGKDYEYAVRHDDDHADDDVIHKALKRGDNDHLEPHEIQAIVDSGGEEESHVNVTHKGETYKHHVINHQEPQQMYGDEDENEDENEDEDDEDEQINEGRFRRSMQGYRVLGGYGYGNKVRYQSSDERSREINVGLDDKQEKENALRAAEADDKDLPFDPNATRPEMPAGKQPAEYRYVRNLARNAMKAGIAATADDLVAQHNAIHTVDEEVDTNDLVPRSMLPSKSVIPPGKGFGDDIKREKIMQKTVKAIQKKKAALPTNNPSENELVPQSMLPDDPAASYPPGYIVPEPIPTVPAVPAAAKGQKPIIKEEDESPFVSSASKFLTRTSARLVYGDKND